MNNLKKTNVFFLLVTIIHLKPSLDLSSPNSYFILDGPSATLNLAAPVTNVQGILKITDKSASSLTQTTVSDNFEFNGGTLEAGDAVHKITGTLKLAGDDTIDLTGNETLHSDGTVLESITVSGTGNVISGSPTFAQSIVLADASTELTLDISENLTNNITLNGGKLILGNDLSMKDGTDILGSGTIDINGKSLQLPVDATSPLDGGDIELINANDITVRTRTIKNNRWNFTTNDSLRGWGVIVDLSGGGEIRLQNSNRTLDINNLHLRGLGAGKGKLTIVDPTSRVRLTNCTLELDGNFTFEEGQLLVDGDNCKVIAQSGEQFIVDGSNTKLTIDGVVLRYDALGEIPANPFTTANGGTIEKLNGGDIKSTFIPGGAGTTEFDSTTPSSDFDLNLGESTTLEFTNDTPVTPKAITFSGNGQAINFAESTNQPFVVEENVTLSIEDTVINNFDPAKFSFAGSGGTKGKVQIGNNTTLKQNKDLTLSGDPVEITGNATFEGNGNILNIPTQKLTVDGSSTLTLKNVVVNAETYDSIKVMDQNATVKLQKMELNLTSTGLTFDTGNLVVDTEVTINGAESTAPNQSFELNFTSPNNITVNDNSTLKFGRDTTFNYNPDTSGDANSAAEKRHIVTNSHSSKIVFDHATFNCGTPGTAFDLGRFFVEGNSKFVIPGAALEINSNVNLTVMPGAILSFDGPVLYT